MTSSISEIKKGSVPIAIIMITLNEGHNMKAVLDNIQGWASEVFIVDSFSSDDTVDIALKRGVHVVQRKFEGFGDQWNFALKHLPITSPWTMKIDPDERLTDELKRSIEVSIKESIADAFSFDRQLWFMGKQLPIRQSLTRIWKTGKCHFTDVKVNEYPVVDGDVISVGGDMEHYDSPDLHHWYEKQNKYTTAESIIAYRRNMLSETPKLFGDSLQRRMWMKKNYTKIPFRYFLLFIYHYIYLGTWRAGKVGYIWARLRVDVYRAIEYKYEEICITGREPNYKELNLGKPDERVPQY